MKISKGFVMVLGMAIFFITAVVFIHEQNRLKNTVPGIGIITQTRSVPRKILVQLEISDRDVAEFTARTSVPFWDSREIGQEMKVRLDPGTKAVVCVDEFFFRHKTFLGILLGSMVFFLVLLGIQIRLGQKT